MIEGKTPGIVMVLSGELEILRLVRKRAATIISPGAGRKPNFAVPHHSG